MLDADQSLEADVTDARLGEGEGLGVRSLAIQGWMLL